MEKELKLYKDLGVLRSTTTKDSVYFVLNQVTQKVHQIWVTNNQNVAKQVDLASVGTTNLTYFSSPTSGIVTSDTGTDATIPLANDINAGLLSPAEKAAILTALQPDDLTLIEGRLDDLEADVLTIDSRVEVLENLQNLQTNFTGQAYAVWTGVGLIFDVTYPNYYIEGVLYIGATEQITLDPSDPTFPRLDIIAVDSTGAIKITGVASADPVLPTVDTTNQIQISVILVNAGATTPEDITEEVVYKENVEWTTSSNNVTVNFDATSNPFQDTKHIDCGAFTNSQYLRFINSTIIQTTDFQLINLKVNLKATFSNSTKFSFRLYNGVVPVSNVLTVNSGAYNFDRTIVNTYQTLLIPLSSFTLTSSSFDRLDIIMVGNNTSGFRLDNIVLAEGIGTNNPLQKAIISIVTDSGVVNATQADDSIQILGTGGTTTTSTGKTITINSPETDGFVPYTGATTDVDLGEFQLKAGQLELDQTPTGTFSTAKIRWNDTAGTAEIRLKGNNVTLQLGQELVKRVVNKTVSNITLQESNYQVVKIIGATGQRLSIDLAQANSEINSSTTLGLVTENISNNQEGFVTFSGEVNLINTTGSLQGETWVDGDVLYLSPTVAGALTKIAPTAPNHTVKVAYVQYAHITQGKLHVDVDTGYSIDNLHNVAITGTTANKVIGSTTEGLWENKTIPQILGYTPADISNIPHNDLTGLNDGDYQHLTVAEKANIVNKTGNETIAGVKTFTDATVFTDAVLTDQAVVMEDGVIKMSHSAIEIQASILAENITADRSLQLPDASGTFALTTDIPATPTIDATPTDGSTNAVSSNGVFDALPKDYAVVVYVNTNNPNSATIFDDENPPIANDNALKVDVDNLYIGTDSSTWVYNGVSYVTKTVKAVSNFYIAGTTADAGNTKSSNVERYGSIKTTTGFIKDGGTSSQFLKADGSVDSSTYLSSVPTLQQVSNAGKTVTYPDGTNGMTINIDDQSGNGFSGLTVNGLSYGTGVNAYSVNGTGINTYSINGVGVNAYSDYGTGVNAYSVNGTGIIGTSITSNALVANIPTSNTSNIAEFQKNNVNQVVIQNGGKITATAGTASTDVVVKSQLDLKANQDGTILYHSVKWFTPSSTVSSSGTTVTSIGTQFESGMVGAKLTIEGEQRIITGFTSSTVVTVDSAYSTNYSGVVAGNWGVYSKAYASSFLVGGNTSTSVFFNTTGTVVIEIDLNGNYITSSLYAIFKRGGFNRLILNGFDYFGIADSSNISFSANYDAQGTKDLGLRRNAAGTLEIYDGVTPTTYRDLKVRKLTASTSVQVGDDAAAASSANVGSMRYRADANNSYVEMCVQNGSSSYAWQTIIVNTW